MFMGSLYCGERAIQKLACEELKLRFRRIKPLVGLFFNSGWKWEMSLHCLFLFTYPILYDIFSLNAVVVISTDTISQLFETGAVAV